MSYNVTQQAYAPSYGTVPTNGIHFDTRNPTVNDVNYPIGKFWLNTSNEEMWFLNNQTTSAGFLQSNWVLLQAGIAVPVELEGNSGGPISPNGSGIIFTVGSGPISVSGNAGSSTLTWALDGTVATSYVENSGTAIPSGNVLHVVGGAGITTSGAGNTITITGMSSVPLQFTEDTGTAIPSANNLNVFGGTGIKTSGSLSTVTIAVDNSIVGETITGNTGGALSPTAGNWNIVGGTGVSTAGAGSTLTINVTGGGFTWVDVTGTTQAMAINTGYVSDNAGLVTLTLPTTAAFGSVISVVGKAAGGWTIAQNVGQQIVVGNVSTTAGVSGSVSSTNQSDTITLLCTTANSTFTRLNVNGNLRVT